MARKVLPLPAPPRTSTRWMQTDGIEDDGLMFGERVGGILVGQGTGDDIALRQSPAAQRRCELADAFLGEQGSVDLLADQDVVELVYQVGELRAVDDLPARALRQGEVVGQLGVGQDDDVVPARSPDCPPRVALDVVTQRVTGFASLADRFDVHVLAAAELAPAGAVVPHLPALDLETDDPGPLDRDDEVDLVILEVVGDALAGDDEVVGLKLFGQRLVDAALGAVGETWAFGRGDGHGLAASTPSSQSRISNPPRSARLLRATPTMLSRVPPCRRRLR